MEESSADSITVMNDDGTRSTYLVAKFQRSNQGTCFNQKPVAAEGQRVEAGQVIADGPCTDNGEMALGRNRQLVAFRCPGRGATIYEDAINCPPAGGPDRRPVLDPIERHGSRRPGH